MESSKYIEFKYSFNNPILEKCRNCKRDHLCKQFPKKYDLTHICDHCYCSKDNSRPISCSKKDWFHKLNDWSPPTETFTNIPIDIIFSYILKYFQEKYKGKHASFEKDYLVYLSRCVQVSKDWYDYFNNPMFWKPAFVSFAVNKFYEKKKILLMNNNTKKIKSSDWTNKDIQSNRCPMVVINETEDIPFDIFWISKSQTKSVKGQCHYKHTLRGKKMYHCATTYPNARWMCIPTKEWLRENPYSTIGFTWTIDVFDLQTYKQKDGEEFLAYVVHIDKLDLSKMNPIKDTTREIKDYRRKIIQIAFDQKEIEYNWGCNREERRYKIKDLQEVRKKARKIRKEIYISEQKSKDQLYILNMFD